MISVIFGDEPWLVDRAVKKITEPAKAEWRLSVHTEWDGAISDLSGGFFGAPVVLLKCRDIPKELSTLTDSEGWTLVVTPERVDRRTAVYKELSKRGLLTECRKVSEAQLTRFILKAAEAHGMALSDELARYLGQRTGYTEDSDVSLYTVKIAVDRLFFTGRPVTGALIDAEVRENVTCKVYELFDILAKGDTGKCIDMYQHLSETESAIGMVSMMLRSARIGLKASACPEHAREIGVPPMAYAFAKGYGTEELKSLCGVFEKCLVRLKSSADEKLAVTSAFYEANKILKGGRQGKNPA